MRRGDLGYVIGVVSGRGADWDDGRLVRAAKIAAVVVGQGMAVVFVLAARVEPSIRSAAARWRPAAAGQMPDGIRQGERLRNQSQGLAGLVMLPISRQRHPPGRRAVGEIPPRIDPAFIPWHGLLNPRTQAVTLYKIVG